MIKIIRKLLEKRQSALRWLEYKHYSKLQKKYDIELSFSSACQFFTSRNDLYAYFHHYYHHRCPPNIRAHRKYIEKERKGFGEEAFHAMWWLLLKEFKPERLLEIGVYRGQVISLWSLINKHLGRPCEVHGISPFSSLGDSVSSYAKNLDYIGDILEAFSYWKLLLPVLVKCLSTDAEAVSHIRSRLWDIIYIDGSHEFEIVLKDYRLCFENLRTDGILILDDASLNTDFKSPSFSFAGHPGPSRVAREYADKEMQFLGAVGHINVFKKT